MTLEDRLRQRQEHLQVAKDAELEQRWDLAMQLREEVRIELGESNIWKLIQHLIDIAIDNSLSKRNQYAHLYGKRIHVVTKIWGQTFQQDGFTIIHFNKGSHVAIAEVNSHLYDHLFTKQLAVLDLEIITRYTHNQSAYPYDKYSAYMIGTDSPRPKLRLVATAGEALSILTDDQRDRMQWK